MGNTFFMDWEVSLMENLQKSLGSAGEFLSRVFSTIGGETVSLLVLLVVLFCYGKEAGKRCGLTIMAASVWFPMIKNIVLRVRPYMAHETIRYTQLPESDAAPMDIVQQGYSFPSGHSAMSVAMYGSMAVEIRKRWIRILAVVLPLLIGVSRFIAGVHYPTDVLAGWAVGLIALGVCAFLQKKVKNENVRNLILLATALPGIFWCNSRDYFTALGMLVSMVIVFPYEKKYVRFADTRCVPAMILRVAGALAIYFALNTVLKLPFSTEFLNNGTLGANLIRSLRYGIILFVIIGVYPRCFPAIERLFAGRKKKAAE